MSAPVVDVEGLRLDLTYIDPDTRIMVNWCSIMEQWWYIVAGVHHHSKAPRDQPPIAEARQAYADSLRESCQECGRSHTGAA